MFLHVVKTANQSGIKKESRQKKEITKKRGGKSIFISKKLEDIQTLLPVTSLLFLNNCNVKKYKYIILSYNKYLNP